MNAYSLLCAIFAVSLPALGSPIVLPTDWSQAAYDLRSSPDLVTRDEIAALIQKSEQIVLGEVHLSSKVQEAQAQLIRSVMDLEGAGSDFALAWEFLNLIDAVQIELLTQDYLAHAISDQTFVQKLMGQSIYETYIPVLQTLKTHSGHLIPTNLSRGQKAPILTGGLSALNPALIPDGFALGGAGYFSRFEEAMLQMGHLTAVQVQNYYAAQCLTDDVVAKAFVESPKRAKKFLVIGSFHTDYLDGAVARVALRDPKSSLATVRFIDTSHYTASELSNPNFVENLLIDPQYGKIADFVIFANEPKP